jgi:putative flippase GtrA
MASSQEVRGVHPERPGDHRDRGAVRVAGAGTEVSDRSRDSSPGLLPDERPVSFSRALYERFGRLIYEFAKFAVVGVAGLFITNAVYDLLFLHLGAGPVTSTTIATVVAAIATYLGNRYWSFRARQRTGVARELGIFAVLNGIGLLIQDAAVAVNYYLLHLGHNKLAGFVALNFGILLATLFRFWSYRRFVWVAPPASTAGHTSGRRCLAPPALTHTKPMDAGGRDRRGPHLTGGKGQ